MSPRSSTLLALACVLLAGLPLPALTAARQATPTATIQPDAPAQRRVFISLQCSGAPTSLSILHEGHLIARLSAEELATSCWEGEATLPDCSLLELEVEATWASSPTAQAVTLTLEPERLATRSHTEWAPPGESNLHTLFSFVW